MSRTLAISLLLHLSCQSLLAHGLGFFGSAEQAVGYAREHQGLVLIIFTGTDWSQLCHEMDVKVWEDSDFADYANSSRFALLNADYPQRTKLTQAQRMELCDLAARHRITHFPTTLALTADLIEIGRHEYQGEDASDLMAVMQNWVDEHTAMQAKLEVQNADQKTDPEAQTVASQPALAELKIGDLLPDLSFTTSDGKPLPLASLNGNAVLLTFIFTRCPLPQYCPLLGQKFSAVQTLLTETKGTPKNWRLLSLTIDPKNDTPEVLAKYTTLQRADPAHWFFATSDLPTITQLSLALGADFWADKDGFITHHLRTVLVAPDGRIHTIHTDNQWSNDAVAAQLEKLARSHQP